MSLLPTYRGQNAQFKVIGAPKILYAQSMPNGTAQGNSRSVFVPFTFQKLTPGLRQRMLSGLFHVLN
uniref:Uncharacterized protein n=1 Tax=Anguilla anguilla TaxID=7936 RepID=A0A0E9PEG3_ANGAN